MALFQGQTDIRICQNLVQGKPSRNVSYASVGRLDVRGRLLSSVVLLPLKQRDDTHAHILGAEPRNPGSFRLFLP